MEDMVCSACGRGMSLTDLEKGSFRTIESKLYCPQCLLKKGNPTKMRCPRCGQLNTVLLHDGKYTCTHCGHQVGGEQQSGVIDSALPAASRGSARDNVLQLPSRPQRRRKKRSAEVLAVLLGCFVVATLVLAALLIRAKGSRPALPQPPGEQVPSSVAAEKKSTPDEMILLAIERWRREHPREYQEAIENYNTALRILTDPAAQQKASQARDKLRQEMKLTAEREDQSRRIQELEAKLATALAEIEKLKPTPAAKPEASAAPDTQPQETTPTTPAAPSSPVDKPPDSQPEKTYHLALVESRRLVDARKHGLAMKTMEAVAKTLAGTEWAKKALVERTNIQRGAEELFNKQAQRADELVRRGDYAGARKLYDELQELEAPIVQQLIQGKLDEIRQLEEGKKIVEPSSAPPASQEVPAAVRQLIEVLKVGTGRDRSEAARKLGTLGNAAAIPHLITALKDSEWLVRACAAKSLGQLGDISAVPALVEALGDEREAVVYDATEALKALTKQSFSRGEKAKWLAWFEANKTPLRPAPVPKPSEPTTSFPSAVVGLRYDTNVITLVVPDGVVVKPGAKIRLILGGEHVCDVEVGQVAVGEAYGKIVDAKPGMKLEPGDKITAQIPQ